MITAISIDVSGQAPQAVARIQAFMGSDAMRRIAGYEGQRTVREHLQGLDETRVNKLGGPRSHYYGSARRSTEYQLEGRDVLIVIPQIGMALHYYGGVVSAGKNASFVTGAPTKYLTIPAAPEAYGKSVSDFPDLVIVWGKGRRPVGLAVGEEATGSLYHAVTRGPLLTKKTKLVPGKVMFWLKESITLQPDPSVLPTEEKLANNITEVMGEAVVRRFGGEAYYVFKEGGGI